MLKVISAQIMTPRGHADGAGRGPVSVFEDTNRNVAANINARIAGGVISIEHGHTRGATSG